MCRTETLRRFPLSCHHRVTYKSKHRLVRICFEISDLILWLWLYLGYRDEEASVDRDGAWRRNGGELERARLRILRDARWRLWIQKQFECRNRVFQSSKRRYVNLIVPFSLYLFWIFSPPGIFVNSREASGVFFTGDRTVE